jgi:hypothetical protein
MLPSVIGGPGERWSMLPVDCGEDFGAQRRSAHSLGAHERGRNHRFDRLKVKSKQCELAHTSFSKSGLRGSTNRDGPATTK